MPNNPAFAQRLVSLHTPDGRPVQALLKPGRVIADEGVIGALRIMRNVVRDKDLRERVTTMARTFKKYDRHLCGVAIVARKPKENQ